MTTSITHDQLRFAIDYGSVIVVDALLAAPYSQRHISGALKLVIDDVDEQAPRLLPEKGTSIVTYSTGANCGRGESLAERLEQLAMLTTASTAPASRTGRARDFPWRQWQPDERTSLATALRWVLWASNRSASHLCSSIGHIPSSRSVIVVTNETQPM